MNRNPGFLTISTIGVGGAVGLTDRLEFGANFEINRRVLVRRSRQLSFGQQELGLFGSQTPGAAPFPNELVAGSVAMPQLRSPATSLGTLTGAAGFYNLLPFASQLQGNGVGTVTLGVKFNVFSESAGNSFGLGFRTYATIPTHRSASFLLATPTQTGNWQYGTDVLLSKNIGDFADVDFNAGFRAIQSPDNGRTVVLADMVPLGFALRMPRNARFQFVEELTADLFVNSQTRNTTFDAADPVDLTVGLRAFLSRYLSLSAGYRTPLNQGGGDKNGFVVNLAYNYGPPPYLPPPPVPPTVTCAANPAELLAGGVVRLTAQASSSTGAVLTYAWSTTGGTIEGSGPTVQLRTQGLAPGAYRATVRVTDPAGLSGECSARITILQPQPPTVSCSADRSRVQVGEIVNLTARASSPDNRPLTYEWTASGGSVDGSGASVRFDTTNLRPGNYTVRVRVVDDRGLSAECTSEIAVTAPPPPPPPPQPVRLDECRFGRNSSRVDNVCKAILDGVALRLQSEPGGTLVVLGSAETGERNASQLAGNRAANIRTYLSSERGIAENLLEVRTGPAGQGDSMRKAELHLVPQGATFTGP